uniref:C-type lectin domain-containing protein n=1 Tax=Timema bartmani TaxID=61472 RepID=A0A7R9ENT4_9NEOP|nr:unnamed protein product [Timema bartmani]
MDYCSTPVEKGCVLRTFDLQGHLRLDHGAGHEGQDEPEVGPWEADVEHRSSLCEGGITVTITAKVTGDTGTGDINSFVLPPLLHWDTGLCIRLGSIKESNYSSPMASLVLTDSSQLTADGFEKLPDQIIYPYAEPYDLQKHVLTAVPSDTPPPRAGPGYELFPGLGYYKLHQEHTTWEEARRTCLKEGAHLLIVNSETEALRVVKVTYDRFPNLGDLIYIGINDLHTEGHFISVFGMRKESFAWKESEKPSLVDQTNPGLPVISRPIQQKSDT